MEPSIASASSSSSSRNTPPLATQVGGHAGVMTTEDGSLLIKPAVPREVEFYQALQSDSRLEELRVFTPQFLGTLKLQGQVDPAQTDSAQGLIVQPLDVDQIQKVLENLCHPFLKPNILDIKLGTILYDETASPEKVARMKKTARETTSGETGVRLTGFQVYDNITSLPLFTTKQYGKSIKPHQLGEGIAKFFPLGTPVSPDTDTFTPSSGLPRETLIPILRAIREEVTIIREVFASLELRMIGGSLLVIYEADWARAEEGIKRYLADEDEESEEEGEDEDDDDEEDEEDEDEDEDDEDEAKPKRPGPPFVLKLIDFAHTTLAPGKGPDRSALTGMDKVIRLLDDRLKELSPS